MLITPTPASSPDEINRLIMEAENSVDADRRYKEMIALRNKLEGLVRNTQRAFTEFGNVLSADDRRNGQRALSEGVAATQSDNPEEVRHAIGVVEHLATQLTYAMLNPTTDSAKENGGAG